MHFETLFNFFILIEFNIAGGHRFSRRRGWLWIALGGSIRSILFRSKLAFRLFRGFIGLIVALVLVRDLTLKIILKLSLRVNLAQDLTTLVIVISATFIHAFIVLLAIRLGTLLAYSQHICCHGVVDMIAFMNAYITVFSLFDAGICTIVASG